MGAIPGDVVGRTLTQAVLAGRLVFEPEPSGHGWVFTAPTKFNMIFAGLLVTKRPAWIQLGDDNLTALRKHDEAEAEALLAGADGTLRGDPGRFRTSSRF